MAGLGNSTIPPATRLFHPRGESPRLGTTALGLHKMHEFPSPIFGLWRIFSDALNIKRNNLSFSASALLSLYDNVPRCSKSSHEETGFTWTKIASIGNILLPFAWQFNGLSMLLPSKMSSTQCTVFFFKDECVPGPLVRRNLSLCFGLTEFLHAVYALEMVGTIWNY